MTVFGNIVLFVAAVAASIVLTVAAFNAYTILNPLRKAWHAVVPDEYNRAAVYWVIGLVFLVFGSAMLYNSITWPAISNSPLFLSGIGCGLASGRVIKRALD